MYDLFYDLIYSKLFNSGNFQYPNLLDVVPSGLIEEQITYSQYFAALMALICTIVVYVCCCLIVLKIIKTVANVFRG